MKTSLLALTCSVSLAFAGPITNGSFDSNPGNPSSINPWAVNTGSRIALAGCTSPAATTVNCTSTTGLVAGMLISGAGLVTSPANSTLVVTSPITATSFMVTGGTITSCPAALTGSNAVPVPTLSVTRTSSAFHSSPLSLRVTGRDSTVDGAKQSISGGLVNGARYTTRFRINLDAPAQVRCIVQLTGAGAPPPFVMAETVVRASQTGQWIAAQGTNTLSWSGSLAGAQIYFAVDQIYALGATAPAGSFPSYYLDTVEMELDTDGDGLWDIEEVPGNTNTNPLLADSDGDGIPDQWERTHGLNPNDPTDAATDADQDGFSNLAEYSANTDPQSAASFPGDPSDSQASAATRALIYSLQTRSARTTGKRLSGQHAQDVLIANDYNTYVAELNTVMTAAGSPSWVSVLSLAVEGPSAAQPLQIASSAPVGRAYMDAGGLALLHWTPRNPWTNGANSDHTGVDIANLMTPGTTANVRFTGWMDTIAAELALFGPDRPVIFRPFSEMNGGWNWYGRLPYDDFRALYRWLRAYFVTTKGLHNIVWTFESHIGAAMPVGSGNVGVASDYYWPGDDAIDLIGFSNYVHNWAPSFDADAASRLHPKAFAITEGGAPANEDDVPNAYNSIYLDALDAYYPRAAFFVIWNSFPTGPNLAIKDNPNYVALLTDPRVTNRETLLWRAPSGLAANAASSTQFALNWTGTSGATAYALESSATGAAPWLPAGISTPTSATVGTFTPATPRHFRVRALYPGADSAPLNVANATTWSLYVQWKSDTLGNFAAPDLADDDGDGIVTMLEYGLGTNPLATSQPPTQGVVNVSSASYLSLTFRRRTGPSGASYVVEAISDLVSGTWLPQPVQFGVPVDNGDGTETVTFRDIIPLGSVPLRLMRLKVSVP